ncbi:hypothetical protein [Streptomyces sp. NPDC088801]|uniref:hypothetical protein n=1 Tax=Streptomyces sp. NPDC088801 TaxID=3365903 RepID=UPI00380DFCC9
MTSIRLLITDDQMMVRQGFMVLFDVDLDVGVVGLAVEGSTDGWFLDQAAASGM